jgi:bidirectional [NiFe] hydrogenase diaphorase subunit
MATSFRKPVAPSQDKRWRIVDATMRRLGNESHALIEALHTVQESFGYLDTDSLRYVANSLRVPLSQAYGVATFYHFFSLKPPGKHTCVVCTGTACYIKGAAKLLQSIEGKYGIKPGETTPDGNMSLMTARCLGSCGLAPVAVFDQQIAGKMTPEVLMAKVERWENHDA